MLFRATPCSQRSVRRTFECAATHPLAMLHRAIVDELRLGDGGPYAFHMNGDWTDQRCAVHPKDARATSVGALGLEVGDTIVLSQWDLGDEQLVDVEFLGFREMDGKLPRPRLIHSEGTQQPPPTAPPPPLDAETRAVLAAWQGCHQTPEERIAVEPPWVAAAVSAVLAACSTPAALAELSWQEECELEFWLRDAVCAVAMRGDASAAQELAGRLAALLGTRDPLIEAAQALEHVGRVDVARMALERARSADLPLTQPQRCTIAELRLATGDEVGAEEDLRRLTTCRWPHATARRAALAALESLLAKRGLAAGS